MFLELFSLASGLRVYSDASRTHYSFVDLDAPADFICILRSAGRTPRARLISCPPSEFISWRVEGLSLAESFSSLTLAERHFLSGEVFE